MKTNFLFKLLLLSLLCVFLNSCTADTITTNPKSQADTSYNPYYGDPILQNPR